MAARPERVVTVVRHRADVLVCWADDTGGPGALPTAAVEDDPDGALCRLLEEFDVQSAAIERRGDPIVVDQARWLPFLVTVTSRAVTEHEACRAPAWETPNRLLRADVDRWWRAYAAVAPTVETVATDTVRGSTAIAIDALWVVRDAAVRAASRGQGLAPVAAIAAALLDARPAMAALGNRVNRAMARAETPADVERTATDGIERAFDADDAAARLAAETVDGGRVLTLSRSGTVRRALLEARPEVVVLASRPGGEGFDVATSLADAGLAVERAPDAGVYARLRSGEIDTVLVGADGVTPDGGVVNKVGTRAAALAAERAGVPFYVVCASDKIQPAVADEDDGRDRTGLPPIEPMFDWTPPRLVTAVLTERGRLETDDVATIAEEHRELARWREETDVNADSHRER